MLLKQNFLRIQNRCVVLEENSSIGSLADKVLDVASSGDCSIKIKKIGIPREFCLNYGTPDDHRKDIGITLENLLESVNGI